MLNFKQITIDSINEIEEFLKYKNFRTCDYTVGALFMWREYYKSKYAIYENHLFFQVDLKEGDSYYTLPISKNSVDDALGILVEFTKSNDRPLKFCAIPEEEIPSLEKYFDGNLDIVGDRDVSDYLYIASDLSELKGRRFSGQRNHINKFHKLYPNYQYVEMNEENKERALEFYDNFSKNMTKTATTAIEESIRTKEILEILEKLPLFGGFIEVEGNIIALSIGEVINDTLYVHIEKALKDFHGAYQMMVNEFAKHNVREGIMYINREDDAGDLGLRTSKLSYHPCQLLNKYMVKVELNK
jgi:hypothetical protein